MMKNIKYALLLLVMAGSLSSCVVRARRAGWVPAHYEYGPNGGRHWVRGHYN